MKFLMLFALLLNIQGAFASEELTIETTREVLDERETTDEIYDGLRNGNHEMEKFLNRGIMSSRNIRSLQAGADMAAVGVDVVRLVMENRPEISTDFAPLQVLPVENGRIVNPMNLTLVRGTRAVRYTVTAKSPVGIEVLRFSYTLIYQSGIYKQGRYIMNAIMKTSVSLVWSNKFDASMRYVGMANVGTKARPVAQATIKVSYKGSSVFRAIQDEQIIRFDALGRVEEF